MFVSLRTKAINAASTPEPVIVGPGLYDVQSKPVMFTNWSLCVRRKALSLIAHAMACAAAVRRSSEDELMRKRLSSCATALKRVVGACTRVRPKDATRRRATSIRLWSTESTKMGGVRGL